MSKTLEIPIQGILTRDNDKKYQAVPAPDPEWEDDCQACAFAPKPDDFCRYLRCAAYERQDNREIVFIRRKDLETDPAKKS